MEGKTVLITGSTCGLGLESAKLFYSMGATVILTCRDPVRGRNAVDAVQSYCTPPEGSNQRIHLFTLDLMSYESVISFCIDVKLQFQSIDVLILNAGVMGKAFELSSDNVESHFATNIFGHFIIVNHLQPLLQTAAGRVIILTSGYYKSVMDDLPRVAQLMGEAPWNYRWRYAYSVSKLSCCVYGQELACRLADARKPVSVYVVRPGFIRGTELGRETHWLLRKLAAPLIWFFSKTLQEGVEPILYCAMTDKDELQNGGLYNNDCQQEDYTRMVNSATCHWLWDSCTAIEATILQRGNFPAQFVQDAEAARSW